MQSLDRVERLFPQFEVNVWGRSSGQNEWMPMNGNARSISNKSSAVARIKVSHMMGCMPGCVEYRQTAPAQKDALSTFYCAKIFPRYWDKIPVEALHVVAVEARSA